jgi:flagella basal body P-ring formation protein FlgA
MRWRRLLGLCLVPASLCAQAPAVLDTLVARVTAGWGAAPVGGWRMEWHVVRGDSTALRAATAEISAAGNGWHTITVRPKPFAAPVLIGRLRVGHERTVPVAARALARNVVLTDADVSMRATVTWGAPIKGPDPLIVPLIGPVIGSATLRALREGDVIRTHDIIAAPVVLAGDSVRAEIVRDGVRLALVGTALHNASLGERVAIRLDRGRRLAGIASGRNFVRLD